MKAHAATRRDRADEFSRFAELRTLADDGHRAFVEITKGLGGLLPASGAESISQRSVLVALQLERRPPAVFRLIELRPYRRPRKLPDDLELEDRVEYAHDRRDRSPPLTIFQRGRRDTGRPDHCLARNSLPATNDSFAVDLLDGVAQVDFNSELLEMQFGGIRQTRRKRPKNVRAASIKTIRAEVGSIRRNSERNDVRTKIASAAAISTPVGPAPTKNEGQQIAVKIDIFFASACFKRAQDLVSNTDGIGQAFQSRSKLSNSCSEITVSRTGRRE